MATLADVLGKIELTDAQAINVLTTMGNAYSDNDPDLTGKFQLAVWNIMGISATQAASAATGSGATTPQGMQAGSGTSSVPSGSAGTTSGAQAKTSG